MLLCRWKQNKYLNTVCVLISLRLAYYSWAGSLHFCTLNGAFMWLWFYKENELQRGKMIQKAEVVVSFRFFPLQLLLPLCQRWFSRHKHQFEWLFVREHKVATPSGWGKKVIWRWNIGNHRHHRYTASGLWAGCTEFKILQRNIQKKSPELFQSASLVMEFISYL